MTATLVARSRGRLHHAGYFSRLQKNRRYMRVHKTRIVESHRKKHKGIRGTKIRRENAEFMKSGMMNIACWKFFNIIF